MNLMKGLTEAFRSLSTESRELYLSAEVPVLPTPPSPLEFYRNWVSPNIPVIIQNNINDWPAIKLWNSEYFRHKIGDKEVTVAVTPNGYADAVEGDKFVMPEEKVMKMGHFLDILDHSEEHKGIYYVQKQNSNFTEEFNEIIADAALDIAWASQAFGKLPDAVNFWMGDSRAVTSMHKDHYENLYCVISGSKTFTLIPPTDLPFVTHGLYKPSKYELNANGVFEIVDVQTENPEYCYDSDEHKDNDSDKHDDSAVDSASNIEKDVMNEVCNDKDQEKENLVPWVAVDPVDPDLLLFPDFAKARPATCTVKAGETLYLPSLWFHHVQQSHKCIAVNFWYDMEYDVKYCYYKFLESLSKLAKD